MLLSIICSTGLVFTSTFRISHLLLTYGYALLLLIYCVVTSADASVVFFYLYFYCITAIHHCHYRHQNLSALVLLAVFGLSNNHNQAALATVPQYFFARPTVFLIILAVCCLQFLLCLDFHGVSFVIYHSFFRSYNLSFILSSAIPNLASWFSNESIAFFHGGSHLCTHHFQFRFDSGIHFLG